jgi:transposase
MLDQQRYFKPLLFSMKYTEQDKIVVMAHALNGLSRRDIVKKTGFGETFVRRWASRSTTQRKEGSGRPKKLTKSVVNKVKKAMLLKRRHSIRKSANKLKGSGVDISRESVHRAVKQAGLKPYHPQEKPHLSPAQCDRRLQFAKKYQHYDWTMVLFSDETTIQLHGLPNRSHDIVWAPSADQVPIQETFKYSSYMKFWGGVGYYGTTDLVETKKPYNAKEYQRVLGLGLRRIDKKYPDGWVLMQDGDRAHTAADTAKWIASRKPPITVLDSWPPNSPDLNIIENVWALLKDSIAQRQPKSKEQLINFAKEEWSKLNPDFLQTLVDSVPHRLELVRKAKGGPISY